MVFIPLQPCGEMGPEAHPAPEACDFCGAETCQPDDWSDIAGGFLCTACVENELCSRVVSHA